MLVGLDGRVNDCRPLRTQHGKKKLFSGLRMTIMKDYLAIIRYVKRDLQIY